jgi:nucleoside-diphosphate-sugar epimerase
MNSYHKIVWEDVKNVINANIPFSKLKNKTVLITGSSGFIGSYLVYTLVALNDKYNYNINVVAMVRNMQKARVRFSDIYERQDLAIMEADVCEPFEWNGPLDYIIHGASPANNNDFEKNPVDTLAANTVGTYHLLKLGVTKQIKRFAFLSTALHYRQFEPEKAGDSIAIRHGNEYPLGKLTGEAICAAFWQQYNLETVSYRMIGIYGPGYPAHSSTATAQFCQAVKTGEDIILKSDGSMIVPHCYVADATEAVFRGLLSDTSIFSCDVAGEAHTILEWAKAFISASDKSKLQVLNEPTIYTAPQSFESEQLARIGWSVTTSTNEGVKRMIESID